jgi:hypothetical protein
MRNPTVGTPHQILLKDKTIPLQPWTGSEVSRRVRLPYFKTISTWSDKVVSPTHRPPLPPGNIPGIHFYWRLSQPQGHSATGKIMSMIKSDDTIGNRTRDLPTCSAVLHPTAPPAACPQQIFSGLLNHGRWYGCRLWHLWELRKVIVNFKIIFFPKYFGIRLWKQAKRCNYAS